MYWRGLLVHRVAQLDENHGPMIAVLGELVDAAEVKRDGMVSTSFDVALSKFNRSYQQQGSPYDQLVDLSTALEAVLIGSEKENEGLTLRLRSRVAALLAGDDDPATALFNDVGQLYSLRSKLVHGGQIKESDLRKLLDKISTNPGESAGSRFGTALGYAIDRMRDIVRRSILARVCLASPPDPLWPFEGGIAVDSALADDSQRARWRAHWRQRLASFDAGFAANRAPMAADYLSIDES
jgi:hypothetical protein